MSNKYPIEKNIPIPIGGLKVSTEYPLSEMEEGDSFFVPSEPERSKKIQQSIMTYVHRNMFAKKFTTRRIPGGIRIWRVK